MAPMRTILQLTPPAPYDFAGTAYSHGWVVLAPNRWDADDLTVERVHRLGAGKVVLLNIGGDGTVRKPEIRIQVTHTGRLSKKDTEEVRTQVAHMFRVDEDLGGFYSLCRRRGGSWKKVTAGLGRLLRSPSVFEDVVKVICTTNTQWGGTKKMVEGLVEAYGDPYPGDPSRKAFPTAEAIASTHRDEFVSRVRMGYRAPFVAELSRRVASGELALEVLKNSPLTTPELRKELLGIKGVGGYAAANLLMLLGRYDFVPVDTWALKVVSNEFFRGEKVTPKQVLETFAPWGKWQGLVYWFWDWFPDQA